MAVQTVAGIKIPRGHKKSKTSKRQHTEHYKAQRFKTRKNKVRSWNKHLESHPNDKQNIDILSRLIITEPTGTKAGRKKRNTKAVEEK